MKGRTGRQQPSPPNVDKTVSCTRLLRHCLATVLSSKCRLLYLQTTIASLEEEGILPEVLKHVKQLSDLITCSGVTKSWHAACQRVQPLHISIGGEEKLLLRVAGLTGILQWLQRQQMQRNLQEVKGLTLNFKNGYASDCRQSTGLMLFLQSVLTLTGCLLVTSCEFFCDMAQEPLEKIVSLLPLTLQGLTLHDFNDLSPRIDLSMFARLKSLKAVNINSFPRMFDSSTYILSCKLAFLQQLVLVPRGLRLSVPSSVAAFLPNLECLVARTAVSQAHSVLSHPCLKEAHLTLIKADSDESEDSDTDGLEDLQTACVLRIGEDSNLESLVLDGRDVNVQLNIAKPNLDLDCRGVSIRFRILLQQVFCLL